jgi:hypothetical protein
MAQYAPLTGAQGKGYSACRARSITPQAGMAESSTRVSSLEFLAALERELQALPVHTNPFFLAFQRGVTLEQLRRFIRQWYTFGIRFRKILIGLHYIDTIGEVFLHGEVPSALGASFGIETTAGLTYRYLYSGLLTFPDLSLVDIRFFETHLFEELRHGDWLRTALAGYADLEDQREIIRSSALLAMEKWQGLWQGIHRTVLGAGPLPSS